MVGAWGCRHSYLYLWQSPGNQLRYSFNCSNKCLPQKAEEARRGAAHPHPPGRPRQDLHGRLLLLPRAHGNLRHLQAQIHALSGPRAADRRRAERGHGGRRRRRLQTMHQTRDFKQHKTKNFPLSTENPEKRTTTGWDEKKTTNCGRGKNKESPFSARAWQHRGAFLSRKVPRCLPQNCQPERVLRHAQQQKGPQNETRSLFQTSGLPVDFLWKPLGPKINLGERHQRHHHLHPEHPHQPRHWLTATFLKHLHWTQKTI